MHIHILGIAGTFMAGIARLAKAQGYHVTGTDEAIYPPMSTQLAEDGIEFYQGYDAKNLARKPDQVVIGNAMKRGNPEVEAVLNQQIDYLSGPEWLSRHVLQHRWVLAISGTHGKTTTTNMLAWILTHAQLSPGYLIGGVPKLLEGSAVLGNSPLFVIEADEYDSAFFDKRAKFVHYRPKTLVINNLEFDHADIYDNLAAIQKQFHHVVRTVPNNGQIIYPKADMNVVETLEMGCWTPCVTMGNDNADWSVRDVAADGSRFSVVHHDKILGTVTWPLLGQHNVHNALAAAAAATHAGVAPHYIIEALNQFVAPARRLEVKGVVNDITVYDDFAHHPTAIETTLAGLRAKLGRDARIIAVLELRSYTMRSGVHGMAVMKSLHEANRVLLKQPAELEDNVMHEMQQHHPQCEVYKNTDDIVRYLAQHALPQDHIVIMSNGGFDGIQLKLLQALKK